MVADAALELPDMVGLPDWKNDLLRVDAFLANVLKAERSEFTSIVAHLHQAGGKRLRPFLVLLATRSVDGRIDDPISEEVITAAAAMELLHLGSLYHDDVIDDADSRRGHPSANVRWGNICAVLGGDFLLGRAMELGASLGAAQAQLVARTLSTICEGEAMECERLYDVERDEPHYFRTIELKTASMIANACCLGGLVAEVDSRHLDALTQFGLHLGMAFHLIDDILDLTSSASVLGKPVGNDLIEGVYSLPVIYAISRCAELRTILMDAPATPADIPRASALIRDAGGIAVARTAAIGHMQDAISAVSSPDFDERMRGILERLTTVLLSRLPQN
jgi:geranylgeranyl pyrophosphate synthase